MIERFVSYASAFEQAYKTADFSTLQSYFAPNATYVIHRPERPSIERIGREEIIAYFDWITESFDRRFASRRLIAIEGPSMPNTTTVSLHGLAMYTLSSGERCHLTMSESASYREGVVESLVDTISPGGNHEMEWIVSKHPEVFPADVLIDPKLRGL